MAMVLGFHDPVAMRLVKSLVAVVVVWSDGDTSLDERAVQSKPSVEVVHYKPTTTTPYCT